MGMIDRFLTRSGGIAAAAEAAEEAPAEETAETEEA